MNNNMNPGGNNHSDTQLLDQVLQQFANVPYNHAPIQYASDLFSKKFGLIITPELLPKGPTTTRKEFVRNAVLEFLKTHFPECVKAINGEWTCCKSRINAVPFRLILRLKGIDYADIRPFVKAKRERLNIMRTEGDRELSGVQKCGGGEQTSGRSIVKSVMTDLINQGTQEPEPLHLDPTLIDVPYEPRPVTYALHMFYDKFHLDLPSQYQYTPHAIRAAKLRFLQKHFRRTLRIKKIEQKYTCCRNRFNNLNPVPVINNLTPDELKPFVKSTRTSKLAETDDSFVEIIPTPPPPPVEEIIIESSDSERELREDEEIVDGMFPITSNPSVPISLQNLQSNFSFSNSNACQNSKSETPLKRKRTIPSTNDQFKQRMYPASESVGEERCNIEQKSPSIYDTPEQGNDATTTAACKRIRYDRPPRANDMGLLPNVTKSNGCHNATVDFPPVGTTTMTLSSHKKKIQFTEPVVAKPSSPQTSAQFADGSALHQDAELQYHLNESIVEAVPDEARCEELNGGGTKTKRTKKSARTKARSAYVKTFMKHLPFAPTDINTAVDIVTKKLNWDVFPFGAKVLGQSVGAKELERLSRSPGTTEWNLLKTAFVLKHFREGFRITKDMNGDWVCCKNAVEFLDCKAFLKLFWKITIP